MNATLKMLFTRYSTYVVFFASGAAAYWLQLPIADQQAVLEAYPLLKIAGPAIGFLTFMVARGLPQGPKE
jgi:hypothetical protein